MEGLNKSLDDGVITSEEFESKLEAVEEEYLARKEKDIAKLLELLGPDGLYLADELQNLYREKGEKLRAFMAENYGQTVILDDYYTPRNIAAYNTMQEGIWMLTVRDTSQGRACPLTQSTGTLPLRRRSLWK